MQGTQMSRSAPTLAQINAQLTRIGMPGIPKAKAAGIVSGHNKERFIQAVMVAHENPSAAGFVARVLAAAGLQNHYPSGMATAPRPGQQPGPGFSIPQKNHHPQPDASATPSAQLGPYPSPPGGEREGEEEGWGESFHVYGGKAALCFNADSTRAGVHTIALDAASLTAPKTYDWKNKIRIQLTRSELPVVAAVLLGVKPECEFKNHGPNNDKGFSLKRQDGGKIFASVFAAGQPVKAVPIFAPDLMWVGALVLQQVQKNCPGLDSTAVMGLIRATQAC